MTDVNGSPVPPPYAPPVAPNSRTAENPGKTLGIVALVLAILFSIIGVILGIVAMVQSKKAGHPNGLALAAIIVGSVLFVIQVIVLIIFGIAVGAATSQILEACTGLNPGDTVTVLGETVECP